MFRRIHDTCEGISKDATADLDVIYCVNRAICDCWTGGTCHTSKR